MKTKKDHWRKKSYQKVNLETKLLSLNKFLSDKFPITKLPKNMMFPGQPLPIG
jgi:hypothetical protein